MILALIFLVGAAVGAFGGYIYGWSRGWQCGEATGRDKQWTDDFIAIAQWEKSRRAANGQFKGKK
jgi:hypothetical protein